MIDSVGVIVVMVLFGIGFAVLVGGIVHLCYDKCIKSRMDNRGVYEEI